LLLDGGRYATPYTFVRTLKRRRVLAPAVVSGDAVRLLTVHGAKGLEARAVFVMDADPEPRNPDTATLLIDWPVESERPDGCAFVYAESRCPPSLQRLLASEVAARKREELNGLYVAMTRAEERLVFSATAPSRASASRSWWQRIVALPAPLRQAPISRAVVAVEVLPAEHGRIVQLLQLPRRVADAGSAVPGSSDAAPAVNGGADPSSRLGEAVHRVLEWATGAAPAAALAALAEAAGREFAAPALEVERVAACILHSAQAARFFGGPGLRWAGNEVTVTEAGEALRIDRLVQLDGDDGPQWWVLDYKLQHAPQELPANREQLLRYRRAVQALQPGDVVRCAFVTGTGEVVTVD
jgi:ATP-dependent helicase/nuclease subunit A